MVKKHGASGAPRHYRKNQRKHQPSWLLSMKSEACGRTCIFSGRGSGNRYNKFGNSQGMSCFNKQSKRYMQLVYTKKMRKIDHIPSGYDVNCAREK